ncbi:hypothetical protein E2542_SST08920 [Spatholobus suberectus]|nr:hypothetical protein E2542_SST08920 [Spatholobus suberectus]
MDTSAFSMARSTMPASSSAVVRRTPPSTAAGASPVPLSPSPPPISMPLTTALTPSVAGRYNPPKQHFVLPIEAFKKIENEKITGSIGMKGL